MGYQKHVRIHRLLGQGFFAAVVACTALVSTGPGALGAQTSFGAQPLDPQEAAVAQQFEQVAGIKADAGAVFYRELRRGLGTGDRRAVCAMLAYPMTHPAGDLADAASCEARYDALFTVPVRRAIGRQQMKDLFVTPDGVVLGIGEVRVAATCAARPCDRTGVRIVAINNDPDLKPPAGKVLIACRLSNGSVRVISDGTGGATLRLYDDAGAAGKPTLEIPHGKPTPQATGLCAWRGWTFDATPRLEVAEVACAARRRRAPEGTVASVTKGDGLAIEDSEICAE